MRRLKDRIKGLDDAVERTHEALSELGLETSSIALDGYTFAEHDAIDSHFDYVGMPEKNIDNTIALLESWRKPPHTDEQKAARKAARRKAHDELDAIKRRHDEAKIATGYAATEGAATEAFERQGDAERAIFETLPISRAGAIALLRFAADHIEEMGINDTKVEDVLPDAIRAAADFFEGRA